MFKKDSKKQNQITDIDFLSSDDEDTEIAYSQQHHRGECSIKSESYRPMRPTLTIEKEMYQEKMTKSHYIRDELLDIVENFINSHSSKHVVIHGEPGVGKTHFAKEIARRLKEKKEVILIDCDSET